MLGRVVTYQLVIFDFDGTLADSAGWIRRVINDVAQRYRFRSVTDEEFESLRGADTRAVMAHLGVSKWKLPFIARHIRGLMARDTDQIPLFAGVPEMLEALEREGVVIAIVSSNAEANVRAILGPENSARIRHFGCGVGLFGKRARFCEVVRKIGVPLEAVIAIGDEVRDIEAAVAAEIAAGAVSWGYATPEILRAREPKAMFESVAEMQDMLLAARTAPG